MEKILSIEESSFKISDTDSDYWGQYEGYIIQTSEQTIRFGISNFQACCENWGYLITNDSPNEFIGAELLSIAVVDEALNKKQLEELEYLDCGGAMFVNFETSIGLLQFVAYNAHNGYYGHSAVLISKQLNVSESL